jgi:chromate transporter
VAGVNILLQIAALFGKLSLLAVGGVNSTLPAIAREVVDDRHWMTREQFAQLFAIANAAPGPNMLVVVLIGQRVGGVAGGAVAGLAMVLPAGILVLLVSGLWDRFRHARWRRVLQAAILPITGGLVLAAAVVLMEAADSSAMLVAVTAVAAGLLYWSKLHPLWVLAAGTVVGLVAGGL